MNIKPLSIGIDFGGTSVKIGVIQGHKILELAKPITTSLYQTSESLIEAIAHVIAKLRESHPSIAAIGAGIPGFVYAQKGLIYDLPNVPGWKNVMFTEAIEKLTSLPCCIDNDANCMAYAEWRYGAGKGMEHLICLTLGTGVGGGIISSNRLIQGSRCSTAEIGQTSIDYRGVAGQYNNLGSVEDYIGNRQITQLMHDRYTEKGFQKDLSDCSPKRLTELADDGDTIALEIWNEIAEKLACAIINTCWLFNPEAVIIGGGISKAGKHLFEPLEQIIKSQLALPFRDHLQLLPAHFGNDAGMIGAASIAIDSLRAE